MTTRTPESPGARFTSLLSFPSPLSLRSLWSRRDDGELNPGNGCGALVGIAIVLVIVFVFFRMIVATLVSILLVGGLLALVVGLVVLTWSHLCFTHQVMFGGDHRPEPEPGPGDEPAYRAYHAGPVWDDLREISGRGANDAALWQLLIAPHLLIHAVLVALYAGAGWVAVAALRVLDTALLVVRRIRITCPQCFERLGYPAYLCTHCGRLHRAIRPGRRGLARRQCVCDARLPTLLILGSGDLSAMCPHCERPLEHRPGEAREFVLPLFGGTGAGKTRLMHGLNLALDQAAREDPDASADPVGQETVKRLRDSDRVLSPERRTSPTPPGREVRGLTVRVRAARRTLVVQLYDAAGERFNRGSTTEELTYLGKSSTFLLVVDPLGIDAVWQALAAGEQERIGTERSHNRDPELAFGQVRDEIERQFRMARRASRGTRLAVVVTRGDLLRGTAAAPGSDDLRSWAQEALGLGNLLRASQTRFGAVRVFLTSAVTDEDGRVDPSLRELMRWALADEASAFSSLLAVRPGQPREGIR